jgi:hypothetical protein
MYQGVGRQESKHQQENIAFKQNGSVRAVKDTPVADYSAPGIDTTHRGLNLTPINVSPFLQV